MCKEGSPIVEEETPGLRADSTVSTSDDSVYDDDGYKNASVLEPPYLKRISSSGGEWDVKEDKEPSSLAFSILTGAAAAAGMTAFALWFPFFLAPGAATRTYDWAYYTYDAEISHFDSPLSS